MQKCRQANYADRARNESPSDLSEAGRNAERIHRQEMLEES